MCMVCERIRAIRRGENRYFVKELETGFVVLGDFQRFRGYTLFLCKECRTELHFLDREFRKKFLEEMALTAEAVYYAFGAEKLNYELLGAGEGVHMHWHIFPRRAGDTPGPGPVWQLPKAELYDEKYCPSDDELIQMKEQLKAELEKRMSFCE